MKTKLLILSFISALTILVSCERPDSDFTAQSCLDVLAKYYPYSLDEDFIFVNDSLGKRWEAQAYDNRGKGIYPWTHITSYEDERKGNWICEIEAPVLENDVDPKAYKKSYMYTCVEYSPEITPPALPIQITWIYYIYLSGEEWYNGNVFTMNFHNAAEFASDFPDTIVLPINNHHTSVGSIPVPEGSYIRIVKNKGITDLSLDGGQTIWRRVKE